MTQLVFEPPTFRLVWQCLNLPRYRYLSKRHINIIQRTLHREYIPDITYCTWNAINAHFRNSEVWLTVHRESVWIRTTNWMSLLCIFYFSSNSCSTCFGQPCAHHQELTTARCYSLVLVCAVAAGRLSSLVDRQCVHG